VNHSPLGVVGISGRARYTADGGLVELARFRRCGRSLGCSQKTQARELPVIDSRRPAQPAAQLVRTLT
jgi:hypothetical protein